MQDNGGGTQPLVQLSRGGTELLGRSVGRYTRTSTPYSGHSLQYTIHGRHPQGGGQAETETHGRDTTRVLPDMEGLAKY